MMLVLEVTMATIIAMMIRMSMVRNDDRDVDDDDNDEDVDDCAHTQ